MGGDRRTSRVRYGTWHCKVVVAAYLGLSQGREQFKKEAVISVKRESSLHSFQRKGAGICLYLN